MQEGIVTLTQRDCNLVQGPQLSKSRENSLSKSQSFRNAFSDTLQNPSL